IRGRAQPRAKGQLPARRRLRGDALHPRGRPAVHSDGRRRDLRTKPDPARVSRCARRQCPLCAELGRHWRHVWPRCARAAARRATVTAFRGGKAVPNKIPRDELAGSQAANVQSPSGEGFDLRVFRTALGPFATGVTIITARGRDGGFYGLPATSFPSVSLTPPLVLWSASLYA